MGFRDRVFTFVGRVGFRGRVGSRKLINPKMHEKFYKLVFVRPLAKSSLKSIRIYIMIN